MKKINLLFLSFTLFFFSCTSLLVKPLIKELSKELTIEVLKKDKKEVKFIGMAHIASPAFYNQVANQVKRAKEEGAVLFYEFIDYDKADTITLRKTQKISGFVPSPKIYAKVFHKILKKGDLVTQNNDQFLNLVNDKDFNIDYSPQRIIKEYEEKFGKIVLTQEELKLPLYGKNPNTEPTENMKVIILEHRNKYLAEKVNKSKFNKIIVLYGKDHFSGFMNELKKLDKNWKKVNTITTEIKE